MLAGTVQEMSIADSDGAVAGDRDVGRNAGDRDQRVIDRELDVVEVDGVGRK